MDKFYRSEINGFSLAISLSTINFNALYYCNFPVVFCVQIWQLLFSRGLTAEEATSDIVSVQIPQIAELMRRGELYVDNIDVFCEKGVYNVQQTRAILEAGQRIGLDINFHGEELSCLHSAEVTSVY